MISSGAINPQMGLFTEHNMGTPNSGLNQKGAAAQYGDKPYSANRQTRTAGNNPLAEHIVPNTATQMNKGSPQQLSQNFSKLKLSSGNN